MRPHTTRAADGEGCNLHGWAYTHGCPGCDQADDAAIYQSVRWRLRKIDYLPTRYALFKGYDNITYELDLGPWIWSPARKGPLSGRVGHALTRILNRIGFRT